MKNRDCALRYISLHTLMLLHSLVGNSTDILGSAHTHRPTICLQRTAAMLELNLFEVTLGQHVVGLWAQPWASATITDDKTFRI